MSRQSRLIAGFISQLATVFITANSALAVSAGETNSIVTCVQNDRAGSVTLFTRKKTPLSAPQVSYLPGEDGEIIMTADFDGLSWNLPTRIIRINGDWQKEKGIREVRVGQLQVSPPVCRISVVTTNGRALRSLNFKSIPGSLIVRWPVEPQQLAPIAAYNPPNSSDALRYTAPNTGADPRILRAGSAEPLRTATQPPPTAPSIKSYSTGTNNREGADTSITTAKPKMRPLPVQSSDRRNSQLSSNGDWLEDAQDPDAAVTAAIPGASGGGLRSENRAGQGQTWIDEAKPPTITLSTERDPSVGDSSNAAFRLRIKSDHSLTYSTFRLSNPERYVIDFLNCPELVDAQLPDAQSSEFIRSVRVGQPDDPAKTRLVIDLINEPVAIKEQVQRDASILTIRLSRSLETADHAATQVPVPGGTSIVLDAGHGGSDPGAQRGDVQEKQITLDIIEKLRRRLEARGFRVSLTRGDDTFVSLEDRVRITNNLQPTLFLSVHINAMETANDIHGIETYYQTEQSRALADAIHENLVTRLDAPDRAVRKARFYVINHTPVPAVLAEVGFISNKDERDKLISSDYQGRVASALEQGVMLYLDKQLARTQPDNIRTGDRGYSSVNASGAANATTGTTRVYGKSNNPSIAQRRTQFEDAAR
ncbi:MAG TPA: N-acetylmuramoyl-L-alanine amidase [Oculatellaceae cyanobacterium]